MKYGKYPTEFKKRTVARYLEDPTNQIGHFSRDNGIPESSLREWIRQSENGTLGVMTKKKYAKTWTLAEKFEAIQEYEKLDEQEKGKWLRRNGVSNHRIERWKEEILEGLTQLSVKPTSQEKKKIKALEKEIDRKDKALAEASALLFAKKKLDAIYGEGAEED